ncbi:hypothetical protein [Nocardioides alcanivorans]|uniref:hypothetical protein n=1 Tax=Nocardioides alcanivorans TaxID=2897352 RepID=UPI001F41F34D|nr:hypothetical protein [Nocardioides alcanivorans]
MDNRRARATLADELLGLAGQSYGAPRAGFDSSPDPAVPASAAADNLLAKAYDGLLTGDRDRTDRFVDRAVALPYDDHISAMPAAMASSMALFNRVIDELEDSHVDDATWLDAALEVLEGADGWGKSELRMTLTHIDDECETRAQERRRIRAAVAGVPIRASIADHDLSTTELTQAVHSVLRTLHQYDAALARHRT